MRLPTTALILALAMASPVEAQRYTVAVNGGAAIGNWTEASSGLETLPGPSFGAVLDARLLERVSGYGAFTRSSFGCEEGFCTGQDVTLISQGVVLGGRWSPEVPWGGPGVWARAGLAVQWLQVQREGADTETTDAGVGFDVGLGADIGLGDRFVLRPGVAYRRHGASTTGGDEHVAVLTAELGLAVRLGG